MGCASVKEVLEYIDDRYNAMLERPKMFASNPQVFEELLIALEDVREFAITGEPSMSARFGYSRFLCAEGFGAAAVSTPGFDHEVTRDRDLFDAVAEMWRRFLNSRFRISGTESLDEYQQRCDYKLKE